MMTTATLKKELDATLENILSYWLDECQDFENGGFIGQVDYNNHKHHHAEKGAVLNARILWTFAAAFQYNNKPEYLKTAKRAFAFIETYFYNKTDQGIYWSVNADGSPKDTKNQIYALAFTIYGLTEFYAVSKDKDALELAIQLYESIEKYSFDPLKKGYLEAFTSDWKTIDDLRLSEKDANEKKTMNTHLHIVEAYANLYKVWPNIDLKQKITELLETIEIHFINTENGHLRLFFDENWIEKPDVVSYGHDIEAAWLLQQCAQTTENAHLIERYKKYALLLTDATLEGIDEDGGLWYEFDPDANQLIAEKHWWPQAELLIGFFNAYELTQDEKYLDTVYSNWEFIKKHLIDHSNGEWIWGVYSDYSPIQKDKAGFWKCPYHNGRACLELIQRIKKYDYEKV
ncbi:AGE family epimerase/isomerase [Flavobacterium sp.]|uniref:AGE family epimerase/isomerase n=1 Tax=Flavobacterium sp. TaxID=239 RepID=UPI00261F4820|nr:AGE family epimerase/isomerase [Flavobacterium sp.]